jgi:hypothetical protein
MKARLYRGPFNGKVLIVQDSESSIILAKMKPGARAVWAQDSPVSLTPMPYDNHIYYRTKHTHPDGSVFFEWSRPRRG